MDGDLRCESCGKCIKTFIQFRISFRLKHALMTFGERFSQGEIDDAYEQMSIDNQGRIDSSKLIAMLTASAEGEEEGEAA